MKVAVCVSGIVQTRNPLGNLNRYNDRLKEKFAGADFYYATWDKHINLFKKTFIDNTCYSYPEPKINYHPFLDIKKEHCISEHFFQKTKRAKTLSQSKLDKNSHHTKQIIIHALLLKDIPKYDVIVRARFDNFINRNANFLPYIEDSYNTGITHGFAVTKHNKFNDFYDSKIVKGSKHESFLLDQIIIHRYDKFNSDKVLKLNKEKRLHPAEWGWYQTLSYPGINHKNHHGFVNPDWSIQQKFFIEHL